MPRNNNQINFNDNNGPLSNFVNRPSNNLRTDLNYDEFLNNLDLNETNFPVQSQRSVNLFIHRFLPNNISINKTSQLYQLFRHTPRNEPLPLASSVQGVVVHDCETIFSMLRSAFKELLNTCYKYTDTHENRPSVSFLHYVCCKATPPLLESFKAIADYNEPIVEESVELLRPMINTVALVMGDTNINLPEVHFLFKTVRQSYLFYQILQDPFYNRSDLFSRDFEQTLALLLQERNPSIIRSFFFFNLTDQVQNSSILMNFSNSSEILAFRNGYIDMFGEAYRQSVRRDIIERDVDFLFRETAREFHRRLDQDDFF
jgi:hypothetical protein